MLKLVLSSTYLSCSRKVNRFYEHAYESANRRMLKIIHSFRKIFVIFKANLSQIRFLLCKRFVTKSTRRRKRTMMRLVVILHNFVVRFCLLE